jgi:hypothetical protein
MRHQRTAGLRERTKGLVARNNAEKYKPLTNVETRGSSTMV